jgi:hypothetical protein
VVKRDDQNRVDLGAVAAVIMGVIGPPDKAKIFHSDRNERDGEVQGEDVLSHISSGAGGGIASVRDGPGASRSSRSSCRSPER